MGMYKGQPIGYYVNAIKIMCEYIKSKVAANTLTEEGVIAFMRTTARNVNYPHLQDAFEVVLGCINLLYDYSKAKGFIPQDYAFDDFLKEHSLNKDK